jgi:two-component system chemotaxis response regulator CheB
VVGVVLSGTLDDGTAGLRFLKQHGGAAIVQDPADALYPGMPESAIANVQVDRVEPVSRIADAICAMLDEPLNPGEQGADAASGAEANGDAPDLTELPPQENELPDGDPTPLTCPECGGVLHESGEGPLTRFSCQVGHIYSPESLANGQADALEGALWGALRSLEERADLLRRMARRAVSDVRREKLLERADQVEQHARVVYGVVARLGRAEPEGATVGEDQA